MTFSTTTTTLYGTSSLQTANKNKGRKTLTKWLDAQRGTEGGPLLLCATDDVNCQLNENNHEYYEDLSGKPLNTQLVQQARQEVTLRAALRVVRPNVLVDDVTAVEVMDVAVGRRKA